MVESSGLTMRKGIIILAHVWFSVALYEALPTPSPATNHGALAQRSCTQGLYPSASLCCLNCPAGKHQVSPCTSDRGSSVCSECPRRTFTEHSNHLHSCLTCTRCRPDQEEVQPCSSTMDTVCRCKAGYFCPHDQACEVCQRCKSCKDGETQVERCTAHSNSVCAPTPRTPTAGRSPDSGSAPLELWWLLVVPLMLAIAVFVYKKRSWLRSWMTCLPSLSPGHSQKDATGHGSLEVVQNALNGLVETPLLPSEDPRNEGSVNEDPGLGSSSSETSLPILSTSTFPPAGWTPSRPSARNDDDSLLVPLKDESLKRCFEYFDEVDYKFRKKFFRSLELKDNKICDANSDDHVYELLYHWLQREGREATLQHLLRKLRDLDQNMTADSIVEKAINNGHYERRVIPQPS